MARKIPDDRFDQLIDTATQVFIEQGYRRTQMADIAEAMGVAKGTLYLTSRAKRHSSISRAASPTRRARCHVPPRCRCRRHPPAPRSPT
jgi:hypothetical protein